MGLLLLLVIIWLMTMYFKWVKKSARKSQGTTAQCKPVANVL